MKWYDRNERFFGREGQQKLSTASVAIVGVGGLGTHVVQQLALLGLGGLTLVDHEEVDDTNRNRYVGLRHSDPVPGTPKVQIGKRIAQEINPRIAVNPVQESILSRSAFDAVMQCDYVFGCLDNDGPRLVLTEFCAAYDKPYIDLGTDIVIEESQYGGRILAAWSGQGCLHCLGELDVSEVQAELMAPEEQRDRNTIYGIPIDALDQAGPAVVSINGVVASLAVTEFMLVVVGLRDAPRRFLKYLAHKGIVNLVTDEPIQNCYYCKGIRGAGDKANVQRYLLPR